MEAVDLRAINLFQCEPGFRTGKRVLKSHYFLYVHRGKGSFKIGSTLYEGLTGDCFYCPPGVGNTIFADKEDPFLLSGIEFDTESGPAHLEEIPEKTNLCTEPFLHTLIMEMVQEYQYGKTSASELCNALLSVFIERIRRDCANPASRSSDVARQLLVYIWQNFDRQLTHEELSKRFSYHKNSINHILLRETGMTLKNYLIDIRMKKACELLQYSDKPASEIAELCGYCSSVYFSRQFHQKMGMTPLTYRNRRS